MFFENLKLGFKDFGSNKLRTALSVLGIVIGVTSVITITTLGGSATTSIQEEVEDAGLNVIVVFPGRDSDREVRRLFTQELAKEIKEAVDGVQNVLPINSGGYLVRFGKNSYESTVYGVDDGFQSVFCCETESGSFIDSRDNDRRKSVIVLGAEIGSELFPGEDALGNHVRVFRDGTARSFKVVGVMKSRTETMRIDFDTSVYIPYSTYTQRLHRVEHVDSYFIGTAEDADVLETADRVGDFFLDLTGNSEAYRVMSPATMAEMYTGITETLNLFLTGVAAISLIVGGIGIMNIMLVSVAERTKEIGIRKALGASPRAIRGQFLTEAVILTAMGGFIGMVLGSGLSFMGTSLLRWSFAPRPVAYLLSVVFSCSVGIFFGLYPAHRASKLKPVDALSFE